MKRPVNRRKSQSYLRVRRPYPNAADPGYFVNKMVDSVLAVATGMGAVTILFYFVTL